MERCPFGLTNAPATFQRMMNSIITSIDWEHGGVYLDDVITAARDFDDHLVDIEKFFIKCRERNLHIKLSKCRFAKKKIVYLGHELSVEGIKPDPKKILAIRDMPKPENVSEVRCFLGLTGYYRRFIKGYAEIANPLFRLLQKNVMYYWNENCEEAWKKLNSIY